MLRRDEPSFRSGPPSLPGASGLRLAFPALAGLKQFLLARKGKEGGPPASPSPPSRDLPRRKRRVQPGRPGARGAWRAWAAPTPWPRAWSSGWAASPSSPATTSRAPGAQWRAAASARCSRRGTSAGGPSTPSSAPAASSLTPPGTRLPPPLLLRRENRGPGNSRGRGGRVEAEDCPLHFSKLCPVA